MTSYPALRELAEKATAGPWTNNWTGDDPMTVVSSNAVGVLADCGRAVLYSGTVNPQANANFIAAANPTAILDILDKYDAALAEIDRLKEALKPFAALYVESMRDFPDGTAKSERPDDKHAWGFNNANLTWGDFRAASQALRSTP